MSQRQSSCARRREVAGRAGLERLQQARRLVVVFGLARDRQRAVEALARDQREREVDQRDLLEAQVQQLHPAHADRSRPGRPGCRRCRPSGRGGRAAAGGSRRARSGSGAPAPTSARSPRTHGGGVEPSRSHRQQRRPVVDRDAGVVGLHQRRPIGGAAVELDDVGHRPDAVADQAREDAPFALGPHGGSRRPRSPGSASCSAAARPAARPRGRPRRGRR